MGWLYFHRNKQGLRVEPDESIAERDENNKNEEGSSKLFNCVESRFPRLKPHQSVLGGSLRTAGILLFAFQPAKGAFK